MEKFHIAFGVDENFIHGMGVTITSILENNPDINFEFHVFAFSVTEYNRKKLTQLEEKYSTTINIRIISETVFQSYADFPDFGSYTLAIFIRLLIPDSLKEITNRVLYLDADIICQNSIAGLLSVDLEGYVAAVVSDRKNPAGSQNERLGIKGDRYFNSGFIYINVEEWVRSNIYYSTMITILEKGKNFALKDQDALNVVLSGRVKYIDKKFNYLYNLAKESEKDFFIDKSHALIHFAGVIKPWHAWKLKKHNSLFLRYHNLSPWKDILFYDTNNTNEMRILSKALFLSGKKIDGLFMHLKYLKTKISRIL